jgi:hypothetical protein
MVLHPNRKPKGPRQLRSASSLLSFFTRPLFDSPEKSPRFNVRHKRTFIPQHAQTLPTTLSRFARHYVFPFLPNLGSRASSDDDSFSNELFHVGGAKRDFPTTQPNNIQRNFVVPALSVQSFDMPAQTIGYLLRG